MNVKIIEGYSCPYCQEFFDDEYDCENHIEQSHVEEPIEDSQERFCCDYCWNTYESARNCRMHEKNGHTSRDRRVATEEAQTLHNVKLLLKERNKPNQNKITVFLENQEAHKR